MENPPIPAFLRGFFFAEAFVIAVAGILPFLFPETALREWPWESAPFNIRFIGAFYLAALAPILLLCFRPRWAPARIILPMAILITIVLAVLSFAYLDRFDFDKFSTWAWFVLYMVIPVVLVYYYARLRHLPPADAAQAPPAMRAVLLLLAVGLGLYGVFMLAAPGTATEFWPWPIDGLHGRTYSVAFLALGLAAALLARVAAGVELLTVGLTALDLGVLAILGVVIVDASADTVDWSSAATWGWLALFGGLALAGVLLTILSRTLRPAARSAANR